MQAIEKQPRLSHLRRLPKVTEVCQGKSTLKVMLKGNFLSETPALCLAKVSFCVDCLYYIYVVQSPVFVKASCFFLTLFYWYLYSQRGFRLSAWQNKLWRPIPIWARYTIIPSTSRGHSWGYVPPHQHAKQWRSIQTAHWRCRYFIHHLIVVSSLHQISSVNKVANFCC